jgi:hypothetical protein
MSVTVATPNNITSPEGNGFAVYKDSITNKFMVKDIYGKTEELVILPNTSTLQEVTDVGNTTTNNIELVGDDVELKWRKSNNFRLAIVPAALTDSRSVQLQDANGVLALTSDITINSKTISEPSGSNQVTNIVSLTQAEYNSGTPISTTFYIITDA